MDAPPSQIDYQELLLGLEKGSEKPTTEADLSFIHVPLTVPDNVDVRHLRHDEEIHKMFFNIKLAVLVVGQCLFVEDHEPIPELFYVTQTRDKDVFNTRDPSVRWHV
jgi:hypothetical protein